MHLKDTVTTIECPMPICRATSALVADHESQLALEQGHILTNYHMLWEEIVDIYHPKYGMSKQASLKVDIHPLSIQLLVVAIWVHRLYNITTKRQQTLINWMGLS